MGRLAHLQEVANVLAGPGNPGRLSNSLTPVEPRSRCPLPWRQIQPPAAFNPKPCPARSRRPPGALPAICGASRGRCQLLVNPSHALRKTNGLHAANPTGSRGRWGQGTRWTPRIGSDRQSFQSGCARGPGKHGRMPRFNTQDSTRAVSKKNNTPGKSRPQPMGPFSAFQLP